MATSLATLAPISTDMSTSGAFGPCRGREGEGERVRREVRVGVKVGVAW